MAPIAPILSIAIPTYNRSKFLRRNLDLLYAQKDDFQEQVEIIISDNNSTDDTFKIIEEFKTLALEFQYIKNQNNIGAELNILQCYSFAKGDFILVLGDDDALIPGTVKNILNLIQVNKSIGTIFLNSQDIEKQERNLDKFSYKVFDNINDYLYHVSFYVTFISGNIISRKALEQIDIYSEVGSNLPQVPLILSALTLPNIVNIFVETKVLAVQTENTGGYNLFEIFGKNFNSILVKCLKEEKSRRIILSDLFIRFFPYWVLRLKRTNQFEFSNREEIKNFLGYNINFWIFTYPILISPKPFDEFFYFFVKVYGFFRNKFLKRFISTEKV